MRKITKLLTLALAALMIMSAMPVSAAFSDVSVENEALAEAVDLLSTLEVVKGREDGTFDPDGLVNRQEMAAFVYRLMKAGRSSEYGINSTKFADLEDAYFFNMISWASSAEIIKGTSETTFNPKGNITLQDAYVMLVRALGYEKDETFLYPFGYVDKAEALKLHEDIPSDRDYTDNLTRGDVAILLKNAFYADMNEKTVAYKWVYNTDDGKIDGTVNGLAQNDPAVVASTWKLEGNYVAYDTTHTIATKIFGIVEETLVVDATAHYDYASAGTLASEVRDYDAVHGTRYDAEGNVVETTEYEMEDLKLKGSSDDYFMAHITLYVKKDAKDAADDIIIASKSNLVKKTVTAADVVIDRSTKSDDEYFVYDSSTGAKTTDKAMTGLITLGGIKAYLDERNAPISYSKDNGSVEFINLTGGTYDEEDAVFNFTDDNTVYSTRNNFFGVYNVSDRDALTHAFETKFSQVYNNGLYEADVYDVDGDGYAEYIFVKNYDFFQIFDKKAMTGVVPGNTTTAKKFYTKDATVEGTYATEDYVLGYLNNGAAYAKVVEVIEPTTAIVSSKTATAKAESIVLENGTVLDTFNDQKKFGFPTAYTAGYAYAQFTPGQSVTVFVKDGIVLLKTNAVATTYESGSNYGIIVVPNAGSALAENVDYKVISANVDGEFVDTYYVNALVDGKLQWVALSKYAYIDESYSATTTTWTTNTNSAIESEKITATTRDYIINKLANQYSIYTKADGAYTFKQATFVPAGSLSTEFTDTTTEYAVYFDTTDFGTVTGPTGPVANALKLKHFTNGIYSVVEGTSALNMFKIADYSKIIVRSWDTAENDYVYATYTKDNLPKFNDTIFTNVKAVFVNDIESSVETLGILYATIDEFATNDTKDYRIVLERHEKTTAEKVLNYYTLLNVKDGTVTRDVATADEQLPNIAAGTTVYLDENGAIKATAPAATTYSKNTIFTEDFVSYDKAFRFLTVTAPEGKQFVVDADATVVVYIDPDNYFAADVEALTEDPEKIAYEKLVAPVGQTLSITLEMVGTDDDKDVNLKHINTIVVRATFA